MKIALFVHCFLPAHYHGTETYTLQLAKSLQKSGHDPVVVCGVFEGEQKTPNPVGHYVYERLPVYTIDKNYLPESDFRDSYYQVDMRRTHIDLLKKLQPDIIHVTHLINHTTSLLEAARELRIPVVATFTDFFGICINGRLESASGSMCDGPNAARTNCVACFVKSSVRSLNSPLVEKIHDAAETPLSWSYRVLNHLHDLPLIRKLRAAQHVRDIKSRPETLAELYKIYLAAIAPTSFLRTAYERNGLTSAPIHTISFGVDIDRRPKPIREASQPVRFGFIGQIAPHKGTALLVEAFCRLPLGTCELHIYGDVGQAPAYTEAMKHNAKGYPVFFRGIFPGEQMRAVLDDIDMLVIPSTWYENSPLVLLNALASHTPVLLSDVEGLTEFLTPGKNGYSFKRGSVDDLERVLRKLFSAPEHLRELSTSTDYSKSSDDMAEEVIGVYASALAAHRVRHEFSVEAWMALNGVGIFENSGLRDLVSPFPPPELMEITDGTRSEQVFAKNGIDIYRAVALASPKPLTEYQHILDFGCGCGRLTRLFKNLPCRISACDIDPRQVQWAKENLEFADVALSNVNAPLPYANDEMDAVVAISVFTHMSEHSQDEFLTELHRITRRGGLLFLTIHGEQALKRACSEPDVRRMTTSMRPDSKPHRNTSTGANTASCRKLAIPRRSSHQNFARSLPLKDIRLPMGSPFTQRSISDDTGAIGSR